METNACIAQLAQTCMDYLERRLSRKFKICEMDGIEFFANCSIVPVPLLLAAFDCLEWPIVVYVLGIALSILLHELGHAVAGYVVGNPAREICLYICGGYTLFTRNPGVRAKDAFICFCGPLTNCLTCCLLLGLEAELYGGSFDEWLQVLASQIAGKDIPLDEMPFSFFTIHDLAIVNAYMLLINLLPAFPLDGGRIFRWFSECMMPSATAAFTTMLVARLLACGMVVYGVVMNLVRDFYPTDFLILALIAAVVWYGSGLELWRTNLHCAAESGSLSAAAELKRFFNEDI